MVVRHHQGVVVEVESVLSRRHHVGVGGEVAVVRRKSYGRRLTGGSRTLYDRSLFILSLSTGLSTLSGL